MSAKILVLAIIIALFYILGAIYLMNYRLLAATLFGDYAFLAKATLLVSLLGGMWTAMTSSGRTILFLTGFLTGVNVSLIMARFSFLTKMGGLHLVAGGSSALSLVTSGCASCGLPILSLLGLSGSVLYLPLRGLELSYLSAILLSVSSFLLIRNYHRELSCKITR